MNKLRCVVWFVLIALATQAIAQDEVTAQRLLDKCVQYLEHKKKDYRNNTPSGRTSIKNIEKAIKECKTNNVFFVPKLNIMNLEVGDFGRPDKAQTLEVLRRIDEKTILAIPQATEFDLHLGRESNPLHPGRRMPTQTFHITNGKYPILIRGYPAIDLVDGKKLDTSKGMFEVVGTESYTTVMGDVSVLLVHWYDTKALRNSLVAKKGNLK